MARPARDLRPTIVVVNPEEDCSAAAAHEMLDEILRERSHSSITSLHAAEVVRNLRSTRA